MRISKLYMPAVTLAGALALAGCGGGSSTPANTGGGGGSLSIAAGGERTENGTVYRCTKTTGTCPFTRDDDGDIVVAEDSGIETEPVKPPEPPEDTSDSNAEVANKLRAANAALRTLSGGADDDNSALKKANDHHEDATNVIKAQGVSSAIAASAQGVLDAREELVDAVAEAKAKRMAAMDRVETLDDGATKDGLEGLIEDADEAIKAGEDLLDARGRNSLQGLVAQYTGEGNTPAERANKVAEALNGLALDGNTPLNARAITDIANQGFGTASGLTMNADNVFADGNTRTDSMMTFAEIFEGETKDIAVTDTVMAAISLKGIDAADYGGGALTARAGNDVPGTPISDAVYLGIPGVAHCREECKVNGEGWYFVPDEKDDYFAPDGEGSYKQAAYVEWGMWVGSSPTDPTIVRYVGQGRGSDDLGIVSGTDYLLTTPAAPTAGHNLSKEATYTGAAAGLSSRETGTGDDKETASGHFEASVSLTAKFGPTASIEGHIRNFRDPSGDNGSHVNTDWRLDLVDSDPSAFDGAIAYGEGDFDRDSIDGGWTAQAYGSGTAAAPKRPDGIFGAFNADFSDGKASGVYHAD